MGEIRIPVSGGEMPVFVAPPQQGPPWPGVVVLHDVGGMKEDLRNQARWLAREGFLAAAPNLYFRGTMMKCVFAISRDLKARRGQTYDDVEAVRTWLVRHEGCSGKIGVIGFCMNTAARAETMGLCASISSCRRFADARSLGLRGLVSGAAKMRSSRSISAIVCSASIVNQYR
jgi:dienelactone hydrolase